jgi:hypothetical protein
MSAKSNKQLLYHIFNYIPVSRFQSTYVDSLYARPVLYRILNYRPAFKLDEEGEYGSWLSDLLEACGNPASTFDQLLDSFTCAMTNCAKIAASGLKEPSHPHFHLAEVSPHMCECLAKVSGGRRHEYHHLSRQDFLAFHTFFCFSLYVRSAHRRCIALAGECNLR